MARPDLLLVASLYGVLESPDERPTATFRPRTVGMGLGYKRHTALLLFQVLCFCRDKISVIMKCQRARRKGKAYVFPDDIASWFSAANDREEGDGRLFLVKKAASLSGYTRPRRVWPANLQEG